MLQFIPVLDGNTIAIRASGKLTHEDYQNFLPQLEKQINELEEVSLLLELDNFIGWELDAAIDEFKFGMKHLTHFDRIAMVGDKSWEYWITLMVKPFLVSSEVSYFNRENLQGAWDWLREKQKFEKTAEQLQPYKNIVVAVDFSVHSKHASKRAIELANHYQASLTVLNITQEYIPYALNGPTMGSYNIVEDNINEQNQIRVATAESQMKAFVNDLYKDFRVTSTVICGDTSSSILSFLEAQKIDLIIFGAKKKKGLSRLLGSIPHYVQNHSRCEMLIVPVQDSVF